MKKTTLLSLISFFIFPLTLQAQLFKFETTDYGDLPLSAHAQWDSALSEIESNLNKDFPSAPNPSRLMKGIANSSVLSGKGVGSDYASRMKVALIGGGVGVGVDLEADKSTDSPFSGTNAQVGIMLGTNLGWLDAEKILGLETEKLNVYFNIFGYDLTHRFDDIDQAELKTRSAGFHVSYDIVPSRGSHLFRWGGVKLHAGYEYNFTNLEFSTSIKENINEDLGAPGTVEGSLEANPHAGITATTHSIPLEASTNVQLLYFLSLYTGAGVDINFGKARGIGSLNAQTSELSYNGGDGPSVEVEANVSGSSKVNPFNARVFGGVQINLPFVNIFVQADKVIGNELAGGTMGLRLVY